MPYDREVRTWPALLRHRWPRPLAPLAPGNPVAAVITALPTGAPYALAALRHLDRTLAELRELTRDLTEMRAELDRMAAELGAPCPECVAGLELDTAAHTCLAPYRDPSTPDGRPYVPPNRPGAA